MLVIAVQRNIRIDQKLLHHKRIAHSGSRYVCETCGKHFTRNFKLTRHKCVLKKDEMEQEQLKEETGPLPKRRRQITESIQSKAVVERELNSGLELTKEDTLKQFDESENETKLTKRI